MVRCPLTTVETSNFRCSAVIIGSRRGIRFLDNTRSEPTSLKVVDSDHTVLDWIIHALAANDICHITYVGGYHIEKVLERYPDLSFRFHAGWQREGELASLHVVHPSRSEDCVIVRDSTICVPKALQKLLNKQQISVGYYENDCRQRFAGLIVLPALLVEEAFCSLERLEQNDSNSDLEAWLSVLAAEGFDLYKVNLGGLAANIHDQSAVAHTVFGGKGNTLNNLGPLTKQAQVLQLIQFTVSEWLEHPQKVISNIQKSFKNIHVVIRSNAYAEDGLEESAAGRFKSILNVPVQQSEHLLEAINEVIESYSNKGCSENKLDAVLVQPQVSDLAASGVLFTRDIETGAPYYLLNIDRNSGRSDVVTSGAQIAFDTYYIVHDLDMAKLAPDVRACVKLGKELVTITHMDSLDIEFGIDKSGTTYLFQVRPITKRSRKFELTDDDLISELSQIRRFLKIHLCQHPTLVGKTTMFGNMSDWNPAEMIGEAPRPLAFSLYQYLIGNQTWAKARSLIGYKDVRPEPLILSIGGRPYVDIRASLNSFLPAGLNTEIVSAWVDANLEKLSQQPNLHDKIEFEVAITCLDFDFNRHKGMLARAGLGKTDTKDLREQFLKLTDSILIQHVTALDDQFRYLDVLSQRRKRLIDYTTDSPPDLARCIRTLLSDCQRYGTVPFSVLARSAFIAMSFLRSLKELNVFSTEEYETLLASIPTVASDLTRDAALHRAGQLSTEEFLICYGHLRPSSYDITAPNYNNAWEVYFNQKSHRVEAFSYPDLVQAKTIFDRHVDAIESLLNDFGFNATANQLEGFVIASIPGRERAKFEFMKSVDAVLTMIELLGEKLGFSKTDISFLPIDVILRAAIDSNSSNVHTEFQRSINFQKKRWNLTCAIRLPHLIRSLDDVTSFQLEAWTPNFISTKRIVAPPICLEDNQFGDTLEGRIVLIRAADPGYDWIFSQPIAGLITQYGGVASHMAIRAAEFGLPAAIGCGELVFNQLCKGRMIELDCINKKVNRIS